MTDGLSFTGNAVPADQSRPSGAPSGLSFKGAAVPVAESAPPPVAADNGAPDLRSAGLKSGVSMHPSREPDDDILSFPAWAWNQWHDLVNARSGIGAVFKGVLHQTDYEKGLEHSVDMQTRYLTALGHKIDGLPDGADKAEAQRAYIKGWQDLRELQQRPGYFVKTGKEIGNAIGEGVSSAIHDPGAAFDKTKRVVGNVAHEATEHPGEFLKQMGVSLLMDPELLLVGGGAGAAGKLVGEAPATAGRIATAARAAARLTAKGGAGAAEGAGINTVASGLLQTAKTGHVNPDELGAAAIEGAALGGPLGLIHGGVKPREAEAAPRRSLRQKVADVLDPERRNAEREAMTDPLTGLANRRAWDRALPAAEKDPETAVAMFDVRGLKAANDLVSTEKGDAVIRKAADAVRQAATEVTGSAERVFRQGGDELGWIGPKDAAAQVRARAIELMGEEDVGGFPVSLRGAVGDTAAEADAGVRAAKEAETGNKYRTHKPPGSKATSSPVVVEAEPAGAERAPMRGAAPKIRASNKEPRLDTVAATLPDATIDKEITTVPLDDLAVTYTRPDRVRKLAQQIKESGVIDPITVGVDAEGNHFVIEGQHRAAAMKQLGETEIPAVVARETTPEYTVSRINGKIAVHPEGHTNAEDIVGRYDSAEAAWEAADKLNKRRKAVPRAADNEAGTGAQRMAAASEEALPQRQNMQAGANYIGLTAEKPIAEPHEGKPITRQDVLRPFLKALGVRLYEGRVKGKNTLGFYLPKKEAVRIKKKGDLQVAAHELAHLIDDRVPEIRQSWRADQYKTKADKKLAVQRRDELKGVSYDKENVREGFAEFVRLWMTQPKEAEARAPTFNDWFNDFVQRSEYGPALRDARTRMQDWYHQSDLQRAKSKSGVTKPVNAALDGIFDRFRQSVTDDLHGVYRMERELTGKAQTGGVYETARLTRAAYTIAERAFLDGAPKRLPDGTIKFEGQGLQQILEPVAADLDNFLQYAIGRSANELMLQGRENRFTPTEIRAMRALETPEFKQAFDDYQAWNTAVVDFAQAHGIINPASRKLWNRTQYLPMYSVDTKLSGRRAKGIEGNWNGIRRLTGGTGNLNDMLGNMMQNAARLMVDSIKNEARQEIARLADEQRGGGRFMVKIARDTKPISVSKAQIREFVYSMFGLRKADVDAGIVPPEAVDTIIALEKQFQEHPDFIQFWMHGQAPKGDNVVAVMNHGKPTFYEVADPILYRAIERLNRPAKHWLTTVLSYPKRIGQASITLTLDFMTANIARDTLMGAIMSKHGFRPIMDSISGLKSRLMADPAYKEAMANGVGLASHMLDEKSFRRHLERFYRKKKINPRYVLDAPDKIVYALETIAEAFEVATRLGEYKRARANGATPREAAYQGREISTDFAMRGDSQVLGFMYDTVMFLKAAVVSMDRLYRGVAHDEQRFRIAAKVGILATVSSALYLYNRGIQAYQDLPDWDKDTYWHFFVPDGEGGYHHYRYPKIWEIGGMASLAERTTEHLVEDDPDNPMWLDTTRVLANLFHVNMIPQALAPLYEQATNRDSFTGAPIEGLAEQSLQPWARSDAYTPKTLVALGKLERNLPRSLQVSPDRMDALLHGYFNTWATYALALSDAAFFDNKPSMRVDDYPVIKRFYEGDAAHSKYATKFYEMLRAATEARRTMNAMAKQGEIDIANELAQSPDNARYGALNNVNQQLQKIRRYMKRVRDDDALTPDQKRAELDKLTVQRNALMKGAVETMEDDHG